ncbi:MAG TPA: UDP-3-O-(3-hydroxymyristoyl)glucosamine N-acyltransferase [Longimicrobiales bacterium]
MKASEIATLVGGTLEGATDPEITGVAPLDRASASELSFVAHAKYAPYLAETRAGAVLATEALIPRGSTQLPRIVVGDVYRALAAVLERLYPVRAPAAGVHPTALLGYGAQLGGDVVIGPYAVIGENVRIGDRCRLGAHCVIGDHCTLADDVVLNAQVTLYSEVRIGERSIIHSGARIGPDGFGYTFVDGQHRKVPQVGGVIIGSDVEIGANTCIDRGSVGPTEIGDGVKIDNLVHIAHNVQVGDLSIIVAQVGISGSTTIGQGVTLAGQAGVTGHIHIGDGAVIGAQAGVIGDVPAGATYSGYPARPHKEAMRALGALFKLPDILKRLRSLERNQNPDE